MINSVSSVNSVQPQNTVNKNSNTNTITNPPEEQKPKMDSKTKALIGAGALAAIIIAGICISKGRKVKGSTHIKPEAPDVKPPTNIKPEEPIKPQAPEIKKPEEVIPPEKQINSSTPAEKIPESELAKIKNLELLQEAKSIEEFKEICKFEDKKALMKNGEPFNGHIVVNKDSKRPILVEFKDGMITESKKINKYGEEKVLKKYKNGEIKEIKDLRDDIIETYSRDKNGNRVITEDGFDSDGNPTKCTYTITKENDTVVETLSNSRKYIYSKDKKICEYNHAKNPDLMCREVTDKKTNKKTNYLINKKTGEIEELIPLKISKPAHNGIPAYKFEYNGNCYKVKTLEVFNEDGSRKFQIYTSLPDHFRLQDSKNQKHWKTLILKHNPKYNFSSIIYRNDLEVYMSQDAPEIMIFNGYGNNMYGSYNLKTREIDGGGYHINDIIMNFLEDVFGNKEPISLDKLYEEMNKDVTAILKEVQ